LNFRVGIIGFGSAGRRALDVLTKISPDSEFFVVSRSTSELGKARVSSEVEDLGVFSPDLVVLTGPASTRRQMVEIFRDQPKAFFFEKPFALSEKEARAIIELLGEEGSKSQVGYNLRFSQSLRAFREVIKGSSLGRVLSIEVHTGQFLPSWRPDQDYRESVSAQSTLGGGVLLELSHEIDYLRWIFGPVDWVSGWYGKVSDLEIDVEDVAHITFGFQGEAGSDGLVGHLSLDFVRHDRTRMMTAVCEKGSLRWDGIKGTVDLYEEATAGWKVLITEPDMQLSYERQWQSFWTSKPLATRPL